MWGFFIIVIFFLLNIIQLLCDDLFHVELSFMIVILEAELLGGSFYLKALPCEVLDTLDCP